MDFLDKFEMPTWLAALIVTAVVLGFVWWKFRDTILFPFRHAKAKGRITNWMSMNERGMRYFYPLIEFTTANGQVIKYRAEERCEGQPMYDPGTEVEVQYLPHDPKTVKTIFPK
ncbi:MAG: DUF3592 domain-containing protein [Flavobacteriales bacterium]